MVFGVCFFCFFKQKTAYEMRISDWSSDVCSSDLVDDAVAAAKAAFKSWSQTTRDERLAVLTRIVEEYKKRGADLAKSMAAEMGAPVSFAGTAQVGAGIGGFMGTIAALKDFSFTETYHAGILAYEPIGVVGMITPWHWPPNQKIG